ncbi:MAG: ParB N-terminal domain-containing protein [Clostridia bacterium]|nr:ParB N-terminal domain-containing protein [Clostridia bacterium]
MAKMKLSDIDMGLGSIPTADPKHDAKTLLNLSLGTDAGDYRSIPLSMIVLNPKNDYSGEDSPDEIEELARDIERNGLLHNVVVSDRTRDLGKFMILSGERRFKAVSWLYETRRENQYSVILCKVLSGLDELDEMLVLDAANLQTRGGLQDERRFRKATIRFIDNLRRKGGVSERDAVLLAEKYTGVSDKLIEKNIAVETNLHPDILSLLDRDLIPKNQAVQYARLPAETQQILAQNLLAAYEIGAAELRDVNDKLFLATKTIAELNAQVETRIRGMREVDEEISEAQLSLSALNAMAEAGESSEELEQQIDVVRKTLYDLEQQKRMYVNTISNAKAALRKSEDRLSGIAAERKTGDAKTDDIALMINKTMKKAETSIAAVTSKTSVNRMHRMDMTGKKVTLERLRQLRASLDAVIRVLEKGTL